MSSARLCSVLVLIHTDTPEASAAVPAPAGVYLRALLPL